MCPGLAPGGGGLGGHRVAPAWPLPSRPLRLRATVSTKRRRSRLPESGLGSCRAFPGCGALGLLRVTRGTPRLACEQTGLKGPGGTGLPVPCSSGQGVRRAALPTWGQGIRKQRDDPSVRALSSYPDGLWGADWLAEIPLLFQVFFLST